MADIPNDRVPQIAPEGDLPDPKVVLLVDAKKFMRPSLQTFYASTEKQSEAQTAGCSCNTVAGTYCSCNQVCTCNLVCTCQSESSCASNAPSCTSDGSTPTGRCTRYSSSCSRYIPPILPPRGSGGGIRCSCNRVCTCVPVS